MIHHKESLTYFHHELIRTEPSFQESRAFDWPTMKLRKNLFQNTNLLSWKS